MKLLLLSLITIIVFSTNVHSQYRYPEISAVGYRFETNSDLQIYSIADVQIGKNYKEGRYGLLYHWDVLPIVKFGDRTQYGTNALVILTSGILKRKHINFMFHFINIPTLHFNYYFTPKSQTKLTAGFNTDYILFSSYDEKKGLLFSPNIGFATKLGLYNLNLIIKYQQFIGFNNDSKNYGFGLGVKFYSGKGR